MDNNKLKTNCYIEYLFLSICSAVFTILTATEVYFEVALCFLPILLFLYDKPATKTNNYI